MSIEIVFPPISEGYTSEALCQITQALQQITGEGQHGILGGEYGYGCEYENDTFMMHPFCWCARTDCPWCLECYCEIEEDGDDWIIASECGNCANPVDRAPNFLFKPTGAKVSWYKYIGRGMEIEGQLPYDFLSVCLDSLNQETTR